MPGPHGPPAEINAFFLGQFLHAFCTAFSLVVFVSLSPLVMRAGEWRDKSSVFGGGERSPFPSGCTVLPKEEREKRR